VLLIEQGASTGTQSLLVVEFARIPERRISGEIHAVPKSGCTQLSTSPAALNPVTICCPIR
jgi:hypothetical protein